MLRALRFAAGAAAALAIWWYATPAYNELLCGALNRFGASVEAADRVVRAARAAAPGIQVPADQLTYNVVLFAGLAAAVPPRRIWRLMAALLVLLAFHPVALAITIEATYATRAGAWSQSHYSPAAQQFWVSLDFLYRLGGMFALAFVCWYATTSDARGLQPETRKRSARAAPKRRRAAASGR